MKRTSKVLSVFLAVLMVFSIMPMTNIEAEAAYENTYTNTGNHRADIIGVAKTQIGYREGSNNDTKYGDWYGLPNQPWCAMFVSWCARQANIPTSILKNSAVAAPDSSYFNIPYYNGASYTPQAGDLFFTKSFSHVGLVYYTDGNYFYTIEGNSNNNGSSEGVGVFSIRRKISDYYFGVPNYKTESHKVDSSYGKNFTAYPKAKITASNIFDANHNQISSTAWIGTSDKCTIHEVYTDGCCKVSYPLDGGGTKTVYSKISLFSIHSHSYTSKVTKAATCTSSGVKTYTCSCGASYTETIKALGHDYSGQRVYQGEHPHEISQRCVRYSSCGGYIWTGENYSLKSCSKCWKATWTLSQSSVNVKVGDSVTIDVVINGVWPDTVATSVEWDKELFDFSTGSQTITVKGKKVGSGSIKMYVWSDSSKSVLIGSKTIPVTVAAKTYTVKFNANGGSGTMSNQSFTYDTAKALTANSFTRTGYTFLGWSTSSTATTATYTDKQSVKNLTSTDGGTVTLYAVWKPNTYTVKFNANGGTGTMSNQSFTYDTAKALTANSFTRTGYTFLGWSTSSSATTATYTDKQFVKNLTSTNGGTVTLYAVWSKKPTYTLSYNANGGSGAPASQTGFGTFNISSTVPTRAGYTFVGWSSVYPSDIADFQPKEMIAIDANITLYAVWQANTYNVKFNANGGTGTMSNQSFTYDTAKALTANSFTRTGYTFLGWSTSSSATTITYTDKQSVKNLTTTNGGYVTLYAVWQKDPVTVSSISIATKPTKTEYYVGDTFNSSGLSVKITMSDGITKTLTSGFTVSSPNMSTAGTKTVTVTYSGKTATFTIKVIEKPVTPDIPEEFVFSIQEPSRIEIRNKDGIVLHTVVEGELPDGARIEWSWDNNKFDVEKNDDGTLTIIARNNGETTITATVYGADGDILATDSVVMNSKSGFFDKIGGFFRSLFGATTIYEN